MGKLQGINLTPELRSVIKTVLALPQPTTSSAAHEKNNDNDNATSSSSAAVTSSSSSSPRSMASSSPSEILARVQAAKCDVSSPSFSTKEAKSLLDKNDLNVLLLAGVQATKFLINNSQSDPEKKTQLLRQFESSLRQSSLSFAPKLTKAADPKYEKRLERLRLHNEERSYMNLTTNLKTASSLKDDHITAKSMMYAASVGLNMVVAPISFGVFMYFFAGAMFSRFFDNVDDNVPSGNSGRTGSNPGDTVDVRRVIAGVVSGVFMLFVEMILFVIRSHELDAAVTKKSRRKENRANPFGYTEKSMARTYTRED